VEEGGEMHGCHSFFLVSLSIEHLLLVIEEPLGSERRPGVRRLSSIKNNKCSMLNAQLI
jgi:hypothetical protein